jgi:hypothetical protein
VNHLGTRVAQVLDGEGDGTLHSVEVVVDTQPLKHEERSGNAAKAKLSGQVLLEKLLDKLNALLRLPGV